MSTLPGKLLLELGSVDLLTGRLDAPDGPRALSEMERDLLAYLAARPGQDVPREALYREVWGYSGRVISRTVDLTVSRLRARVERDPAEPRHLLTVYGVGYRFEPLSGAPSPAEAERELRVGEARVTLPSGHGRGPGGAPLRLSPSERALLDALDQQRGEPLDRRSLEAHLWPDRAVSPKALAMTVRALRVKLEPEPSAPAWLLSLRGGGYLLRAEGAPEEAPGSFFGREAELAAARVALEEAPLVTLLGAGGVGKTRLALELCRGRGALFCPLADARDARDLSAALGRALGVDVRSLSSQEALVEALKGRMQARPERLLVLDNLEQVEGAAEIIGPLRGAAPMLATSRRPVKLRGERALRLGPLPEDAAAELFADRSGLDVTHPCVLPLVRLLEGLPLALELAAAQLGSTTPEALLERLRRSPLELQEGPVDLPARQRSLEATLRWSWDLLEPEPRRALAWCACFEGGFSAEAAEAVLADQGVEVRGLLDLLRERSWIELDLSTSTPASPRLRMAEATRAFALERLEASGERGAAREALIGWAVSFAEEEVARVHGPQPSVHVARLGAEQANLLAALSALPRPQDARAVSLARGLAHPLRLSWPTDERHALFQRLLDAASPELPPEARARLLQLRLQVTFEPEPYLERAREIVDVAERGADEGLRISALTGLCQGLRAFGRPGAEELARAIVARCEALGRYGDGLLACLDLALIAHEQGQEEESEAWLERGLSQSRRERDLFRRVALLNLAVHLHIEWGLYEDAELFADELLEALPRSGHLWMAAGTWANRGSLHIERGQLAEARRCFTRALEASGGIAASPSYPLLFEAMRLSCDALEGLRGPELLRAASEVVRQAEQLGTGCPALARALVALTAAELGRGPVLRRQLRRLAEGEVVQVEGPHVARAGVAIAQLLGDGPAAPARERLEALSERSHLCRLLRQVCEAYPRFTDAGG